MKYILLTLTTALVISLYFNFNYWNELNSKEDDIQHKDFQRKLEEQSRERMVLADSITHLNDHIDSLNSAIEATKLQIKSIKGKYNTYKSSELSELMERRANGS